LKNFFSYLERLGEEEAAAAEVVSVPIAAAFIKFSLLVLVRVVFSIF
jgi:hypothetical protein